MPLTFKYHQKDICWHVISILLLCVFITACIPATPLGTEQTPIIEPSAADPTITGNLNPANFTDLLAKAASEGSVRVIVTVDIGQPFEPEGNLPDQAAVQAQRDAIQSAQNTLLQSLNQSDVMVDTLFQYAPQMALEVNESGLQALIASPLVLDIVEDRPVPPARP